MVGKMWQQDREVEAGGYAAAAHKHRSPVRRMMPPRFRLDIPISINTI